MATPNPLLIKELRNIEPGQTDSLLKAIQEAIHRGIPIQDYWDNIPKAVMNKLCEVQLRLIESGEQSTVISKDLNEDNPMSILYTAEHFLNQYKIADIDGQIFLYHVKSEEDRTLTLLNDKDHVKVLTRELSTRWLAELGEPISPKRANRFVTYWFNHQQVITTPVPMGRAGETNWCLHRSKYAPDANVPFPSWQRIFERLSEPEAFAAWVWGVFTGDYKGRQMLWLHGPHGEDGKSTMASIIGKELFGPAHNAISNASIGSSEKRFLNSFFENAALVIYPDANNSKCLMSEAFKTVASAGADPVLIERKGRQAYTAVLQARMWICSNHAPEVTRDNYAISRLLYVHIDKMVDERPDPTVFGRLTSELPGFLAYAQKCYQKRCPDNYRIETDASTKERVTQFSDDFYDEYETIFTKYWQTAALTERVEASKVRDIVRQEGLNSNTAYSNFVRWLTTQMHVEKRKLSKEGGKIYFYGMSKRSPSQAQISDEPDF